MFAINVEKTLLSEKIILLISLLGTTIFEYLIIQGHIIFFLFLDLLDSPACT